MQRTSSTYIDLFSGAGGFSAGFDSAGFNNLLAIDINPSFCGTYRANFPEHLLLETDISEVTSDLLFDLLNDKNVDVVIGGPPCQGFSMAGNIGRKFQDDPRNRLYKEFVRIVSLINPKVFVMENVARLYNHNKGLTKAEIITDFEDHGYKVECKVLNSVDYGVPQNRRRVIFIGTKSESEIEFPKKSPGVPISVKEALEGLPLLNSGESSEVLNHEAMNHSLQMLEKMSYIPDGGDRSYIPESLRPLSGDIRKYIRYNSNVPSVTVTGDMRKIFHYEQNRALTVRELARLQSFPDSFEFKGTRISQQQQVGNSVPPKMAFAIAKSIQNILEND